MILTRLRSEGDLSNALGSTRLKSSSPTWTRKTFIGVGFAGCIAQASQVLPEVATVNTGFTEPSLWGETTTLHQGIGQAVRPSLSSPTLTGIPSGMLRCELSNQRSDAKGLPAADASQLPVTFSARSQNSGLPETRPGEHQRQAAPTRALGVYPKQHKRPQQTRRMSTPSSRNYPSYSFIR